MQLQNNWSEKYQKRETREDEMKKSGSIDIYLLSVPMTEATFIIQQQ